MLTDEAIAEKIHEHLEVLVVALVFSFIAAFFAWRNGFFIKPKPFYVKIKGWDVLRGFLFFILAQVILVPSLLVVLFSVVTQQPLNEVLKSLTTQGWVSIATVLGGLAGVWLAFLHLPPTQRRLIWGHSNEWAKNLGIGILTWLISYPIVLAFSQLVAIAVILIYREPQVDQVAVRHLKNVLSDPFLFAAVVGSVIVIVPIVEEFLFRGLLQTWLKEKLGRPFWAILATSLIFAFFHFSAAQGVTNIELLSSLFILSCFLGFLYERQHSLWAPIGLHAIFNAMSVIMIVNSE